MRFRAVISRASAAFLLAFALPTSAQIYTLLYNFPASPDGWLPFGQPTLSGSTLYGMTHEGGTNDFDGALFQINTNGTGYTNLHSFGGGNTDGSNPYGSLILSGPKVYGMTYSGGSSYGEGTAFQINTNGTGYAILHSFTGVGGDGGYPYGSLTLYGTNLYGMTTSGGSGYGTLFQINTGDNGYTNLHVFTGNHDGSDPYGSLTLAGSTLYGMTYSGGSNSYGTVFKINTDGSGYSILHHFSAASGDGEYPYGSLTLSGSTLYGMTSQGGSAMGIVFKISTNGNGFTVLHGFGLAAGDGYDPQGSLTLCGSTLYGMTNQGGSSGGSGYGTVFQINTDGSGYQILHNFVGYPTDGNWPYYDAMALSGSTLYGTTEQGGSNYPGYGIVFSLEVPVFSITGIAEQGNNILITWMSGIGTTNALQASSGPNYSTNNFADIFTVTNAVGPTTNYLDAGAVTNFSSRYYRVRLVP